MRYLSILAVLLAAPAFAQPVGVGAGVMSSSAASGGVMTLPQSAKGTFSASAGTFSQAGFGVAASRTVTKTHSWGSDMQTDGFSSNARSVAETAEGFSYAGSTTTQGIAGDGSHSGVGVMASGGAADATGLFIGFTGF